ncbi:hypothetical protein CspeluHIS016_0407430 [Cutaneotrichosporon spelunceum]|uniref:CENP-V/GFA domain-containing protein n=1 Tax=Cutaneotrichosporon spelunceum TaxID=1672016 RepID=A0AAD3YDH0_9TREE|nr:hypothetical protein CspeluHIS016_0407430 [Cutaneotrichosporon spelunceum]
MALTGTCLCGAVTVTIKDPVPVHNEGLEVCACTDCRQATGSCRGGEYLQVEPDNVTFGGQENIRMYEKRTDAGNTFQRHFCTTCGSSIYGKTTMHEGKMVVVNSGLFPSGSLPKPSIYIYRSSAEKWDQPLEQVIALDLM